MKKQAEIRKINQYTREMHCPRYGCTSIIRITARQECAGCPVCGTYVSANEFWPDLDQD